MYVFTMFKSLFSCFSNHISSLTNGNGVGDWSFMRDTLTNMFLGDNDLTELPKERSGNGNGDNNNSNNNNHHNGNGNGNGGGTDSGNGSGASLAECRMLTWLNLDSNKVHYTGCLKFLYVSMSSTSLTECQVESHLNFIYNNLYFNACFDVNVVNII